jgi:hypothetical protein
MREGGEGSQTSENISIKPQFLLDTISAQNPVKSTFDKESQIFTHDCDMGYIQDLWITVSHTKPHHQGASEEKLHGWKTRHL